MTEPMTEQAKDFERALLSVDRLAAQTVIQESSHTMPPVHILENLVGPALESIGAGWEQGTVALSQVYMSGRICEELVDTLLPAGAPDRKDQPKMAIAVLQDHHLLGKRIVYSVLRAGGYELLDYGRVAADDLVDQVKRDGVEVLLISTLMLASALQVQDVRSMLDKLGARPQIVVGGAPFRFDDRLWQDVGADAVGHSSMDALEIVASLTGVAS